MTILTETCTHKRYRGQTREREDRAGQRKCLIGTGSTEPHKILSACSAKLKPVIYDPVSFTQTQFDAILPFEKVWGVMLLVPIGNCRFGASPRRRVAALYCPPPPFLPGLLTPSSDSIRCQRRQHVPRRRQRGGDPDCLPLPAQFSGSGAKSQCRTKR